MKVGVAIPAHNEVDRIELCLASVKMQTHRDVHAYVALDGCTDGTDVLLDCRRDLWYRHRVTNPERRGWPRALNAACALAISDGCDAVVLMNADDYLRPDAIELMVAALDPEPERTYDARGAHIGYEPRVHHDFVIGDGQQVGEANTVQTPLVDFPLQLSDFSGPHCPIGVLMMITTPMWLALGGFAIDVSLPGSWGYNEDWDFWIRAFKAGYSSGAHVPVPLLYYVMSAKQLHRDGVRRHAEARARLMAKHPDVFDNHEPWAPCACGCTEGIPA